MKKKNYLLNAIQKDNNIIEKIYLYAKDLEEPKYQLLIKKREQAGIKSLNDKNGFIEYSNSMDDIYDNVEDYNKVNLDWLKCPDIFKKLVKDVKFNANLNVIFGENKGKRVNFKNVKKYLDGILRGKIDNKYDAEKIKNDKELLDTEKIRRGGKRQRLKSIFNNIENSVFGILLPSEEKSDEDQPEIIDMPDLENEESVAQRQKGQGLKVLTPKQMIIRLPILLAQLKAGNNSEKLKNGIRQIVYSQNNL